MSSMVRPLNAIAPIHRTPCRATPKIQIVPQPGIGRPLESESRLPVLLTFNLSTRIRAALNMRIGSITNLNSTFIHSLTHSFQSHTYMSQLTLTVTLTSLYILHPRSRKLLFTPQARNKRQSFNSTPRNKKQETKQSWRAGRFLPTSTLKEACRVQRSISFRHQPRTLLYIVCLPRSLPPPLPSHQPQHKKTPSMQPPTHLTHPFKGHARPDTVIHQPLNSQCRTERTARRFLSFIHRREGCTAPDTRKLQSKASLFPIWRSDTVVWKLPTNLTFARYPLMFSPWIRYESNNKPIITKQLRGRS